MAEIEISHLHKHFGEKTILDDVSLSVEKGDCFGILGLSGAGKSTLLRSINGLETIDEGEIYFKGNLLASHDHPVSNQDRTKIAMIFQSFNLLSQKNVLDNVKIGLKIKRQANQDEKALKVLELVGMLDKKDKYPAMLSGGEKQRVAIARSLLLEPDVLLSDEATSALDAENTASVLSLLKKLNKELGLTIIMVSHQLSTIERICNKVAILDQAKLIEQGEVNDVFLNPKSQLARNLIYADKPYTELSEIDHIRLLFDGDADSPLLASIVSECGILVSVVSANTKVLEGKIYGQLMIKTPKDPEDLAKLRKYLELKNVKYEEVQGNGI